MATLDDKTQYQVAVSLFSSEGQILWSRYSVMLTINTVLITLIGFIYNKDFTFSLLPLIGLLSKLIIPLLGIILCYFWQRVTKRGFNNIHFWIEQARSIEEKRENKLLQNPIIKGNKKRKKDKEKLKTEKVAGYTIYFIAFIYEVMLYGIAVNYLSRNHLF